MSFQLVLPRKLVQYHHHQLTVKVAPGGDELLWLVGLSCFELLLTVMFFFGILVLWWHKKISKQCVPHSGYQKQEETASDTL